ncbi:MAG: exodeoxyribonuclease VII large subunit [Clostridiales bacterium]|nr:exodeoxyribonuclease VII large subunit [Clostridiales bacterium]
MIERQALTVTQVNLYIKQILARDELLNNVLVKGELSNFKAHSSGHMYMSLKDESGVMRAVMFRSAAAKLNFKPANGMKVIARGRIGVYERDGQYQLYIDHMEQEGIGDLHVAFEKLKQKLDAEGLFSPKHKKPLPKYPKCIGVVTAPTGAAIRDILNILSRRFSYSDVVLYPVLVQGENSAASIVEAIRYFNDTDSADVLIVGRGGGSIEDLWSFNEECVARAIFESHIPIVSAVGHEIDFTISDFVADLRAPTPSAAAELVVPSQEELRDKFNNVYRRLYTCASRFIEKSRMQVRYYADNAYLKNPMTKVDDSRMYLDSVCRAFENAYTKILGDKKQNLAVLSSKLNALSPLSSLERGFSLTKGKAGLIKSVSQVNEGDNVEIVVSDGSINAVVTRHV